MRGNNDTLCCPEEKYQADVSSLTETTTLYRMVSIRKPSAHTPRAMKISGTVGKYSKIVPVGDGMNPVAINSKPLSIHTEAKTAAQAIAKSTSLRRVAGFIRSTRAAAASTMEVHIQGTSAPCPSRPNNRY